MISRRLFGQALTALGAALSTHLPLAYAFPTEVFENSPLFPVGTAESFLLRPDYSDPRPGQPLMKLFSVHGLPGVPVKTSEAAELFYMSMAPTLECGSDGLSFTLLRAATEIGRVTRRGLGNHVIVHPDHLSRFAHLPLKVHGRDYMPENEAFVFYRGDHFLDAPGVIVDGRLVVNRNASDLPTFAYGKRVVWR